MKILLNVVCVLVFGIFLENGGGFAAEKNASQDDLETIFKEYPAFRKECEKSFREVQTDLCKRLDINTESLKTKQQRNQINLLLRNTICTMADTAWFEAKILFEKSPSPDYYQGEVPNYLDIVYGKAHQSESDLKKAKEICRVLIGLKRITLAACKATSKLKNLGIYVNFLEKIDKWEGKLKNLGSKKSLQDSKKHFQKFEKYWEMINKLKEEAKKLELKKNKREFKKHKKRKEVQRDYSVYLTQLSGGVFYLLTKTNNDYKIILVLFG